MEANSQSRPLFLAGRENYNWSQRSVSVNHTLSIRRGHIKSDED